MLNKLVIMYEATKNSKERKVRVENSRNKVSEIMIFLAKKTNSQKKFKLLSGFLSLILIFGLNNFFQIGKLYKEILEGYTYEIFFPTKDDSSSDYDAEIKVLRDDYLFDWGNELEQPKQNRKLKK